MGRVPYAEIYNHVKSLQPQCIVINQGNPGQTDIVTYFLKLPASHDSRPKESHYTIRSDNKWFYHEAGNNQLLSTDEILHGITILYNNFGTYLLNVTPDTTGLIPANQVERLAAVGRSLEQLGRTLYVDGDALGDNDGSSWPDAYNCLQGALAAAQYGDQIRVAQGVYQPDRRFVVGRRAQIMATGDRTDTFQLINDVTLIGGFAGIEGADPNERNLQVFETILSGDLNGDDGPDFTSNSENSYHVVTGSGTDNTAVLNGFVITAGNANVGTFPDSRCIGGGMYNFTGSPKISNCIFRNNYAFSGGAGMFNSDNSDPLLENCHFIENVTEEDGAGMTNFMGSDPVLTNCYFIRNRAEDHAGGMLNVAESNPVLDSCTFIANAAGTESQRHDGGGMLNDEGSPTLINCLLISNTAGRNGGAMNNKGNINPVIQNCTFSENLAGSDGDGIFNQDSNVLLTNCILWANGSDQIYGNANVSYSNVQGGFEGEGNIDADPLFADTDNGDYHLKSEMGRWDSNSGSWIKDDITSPCIDAGDPNSDWSGETWPHGGRINIGAYGGTRQASMSPETGEISLPHVAFIFSHRDEEAEDFDSLLESYGCSTTLIRLNDLTATPLDSYDLLIVANDTQDISTWNDSNTVAVIEDSGKPIVGLGEGGYTFFGLLGLSIGSPNGGHSNKNSIEVVDPNSSLFSTPYSIEIPEDRELQLYTETNDVGLYLWPAIPETVTVLAREVNNFPYSSLAMQHNRYLLWGFTESPQMMTEIGQTLFINVVIRTANEAWDSEN
jgi:hypothetical protein